MALLPRKVKMTTQIITDDFRNVALPRADLVFVDPPYNLNKVYDGERESTSYPEWVNTVLDSTEAPWKIFIAPPIGKWIADIPEPSRIIYWCKTFVQLRKLQWWQYAVTPILVYREEGAPWYGNTRGNKRVEGGLDHFDWIVAASAMPDVRVTHKFYSGGHPGVTGTRFAKKIIEKVTKPGDLVLDPMCGLGSILVAAEQLDRNGFGVEISEEYANCGRQWVEYTEQQKGK